MPPERKDAGGGSGGGRGGGRALVAKGMDMGGGGRVAVRREHTSGSIKLRHAHVTLTVLTLCIYNNEAVICT